MYYIKCAIDNSVHQWVCPFKPWSFALYHLLIWVNFISTSLATWSCRRWFRTGFRPPVQEWFNVLGFGGWWNVEVPMENGSFIDISCWKRLRKENGPFIDRCIPVGKGGSSPLLSVFFYWRKKKSSSRLVGENSRMPGGLRHGEGWCIGYAAGAAWKFLGGFKGCAINVFLHRKKSEKKLPWWILSGLRIQKT